MNRRGFIGSILAACVAPAIVRADSLMRIVPRSTWLALAPAGIPRFEILDAAGNVLSVRSLGGLAAASGGFLDLSGNSNAIRTGVADHFRVIGASGKEVIRDRIIMDNDHVNTGQVLCYTGGISMGLGGPGLQLSSVMRDSYLDVLHSHIIAA